MKSILFVFFNMSFLKNRRNYLNLNCLYNLLNNEIVYTLLKKINLRVTINNIKNNNLIFLKNIQTNYVLNIPTNILISVCNSHN